MKKHFITILFLGIAFSSYAGWPIGKGRSLLSFSYQNMKSTKYFDSTGRLKLNGSNGEYFTSQLLSIGYSYGLQRRTDFFANLPIMSQTSVATVATYKRTGLGDAQVGFKFHQENIDYTKSYSVTIASIIPLYHNDSTNKIVLGYQSFGAYVDFNYSFLPKFLKDGFVIFDLGYKQYFAQDGPSQIFYGVTVGSSLDKYNQLVFAANANHSFSINKAFSALNPNIAKDFTSLDLSLSYGRRLTRTLSMYIIGDCTAWGKNVGQIWGLGVSLALRLP